MLTIRQEPVQSVALGILKWDESKHVRDAKGQFASKYVPNYEASKEGTFEWPHGRPAPDALVGPEPVWSQEHRALVSKALQSWVGDPVNFRIHAQDAAVGAPIPPSGSGKQMRAQAEALLWELEHNAQPITIPLYRGSGVKGDRPGSEGRPGGPFSWSENKKIAQKWAKKYGGRVDTLPANTAVGLRLRDYTGDAFGELQWLVRAGNDPLTLKFDPTQRRGPNGRWILEGTVEEPPVGPRIGFIAADGKEHVGRKTGGLGGYSEDHTDTARRLLEDTDKEQINPIRKLLEQGYIRYWVRNGELALNFKAGQEKAVEHALKFLHDNFQDGDRIYLDVEGDVPPYEHFFDSVGKANRVIRQFIPAQKWDGSQHPRDDQGRFTEVLGALARVEGSAEFKQWFGNSQVVDEHGKPLVMWRGDLPAREQLATGGWLQEGVTSEQVKLPEAMDVSEKRPAIYFTPNEDRAYWFATSVGYANYARPFFLKAEKIATVKILRELAAKEPPGFDSDPYRTTASGLTHAEVELLKKHGYDSIKGQMDWLGGAGVEEIAVFSPSQVKAIDSSRFDPNDPRIMKKEFNRPHWEEQKHPRHPSGSSEGGRFAEVLHGPKDALDSLLNNEHNVSIDRNDVRNFLDLAGEQLEDPDLTDLQVEGMQIFGGAGLGINRKKMPQIPPEHRQRFLEWATKQGVKITAEMVSPYDLKPTQDHISARRVAQKLVKYEKGKKEFPAVLTSNQDRILDGHHHWGMMAAFALDFPNAKMPIFRLQLSTKQALALMHVYMRRNGLKRKDIAGTVVKKDPVSGRYVTPFVSFDKQGDEQLRMIASLNSSRLATWGFTAEAEVLGATRYKLTAVLDGRTSKFCRMIDGKVFEVSDARRKVIEVLNVQDPEDLRVVQPWPRQTKADMAMYAEMSTEEFVERGLHIPPYHPHCRTLLRHVPSSEGKATEPPVATVPEDTEVFQPVTAEDLIALGVDASPENVAQWNEYIGMSPTELLSKLTGMPPQEVMTKGQGVGARPIRFDESGNIGIKAHGATNGLEFQLGAILDPFTGIFYLSEAELLKGTPKAELAFLKNLFSELINTGLKSSATAVAVGVAGNAAYYAKLGFLPDDLEWDSLRTYALTEIETGALKPVLASLKAEDQLLVKQLLQDGSASALSALVELPYTYQGKSIGEWILGSTGGTWALDLTDDVLVAQAQAYLL